MTKAKQRKIGAAQNQKAAPRKKPKGEQKASRYVGVAWDRERGVWKAHCHWNTVHKHLGRFKDEEEAARKYDELAALHNRPMNWPQHPWQKQAVKMARQGEGKNYRWRRKDHISQIHREKHREKAHRESMKALNDNDDDDDDDDDDDEREEDEDVVEDSSEMEKYDHGKEEIPDVPADMCCPISKELFFDPVVAADGVTYERHAIEEYIRILQSAQVRALLPAIPSPTKGRAALAHLKVIPDDDMKEKVDGWMADNIASKKGTVVYPYCGKKHYFTTLGGKPLQRR